MNQTITIEKTYPYSPEEVWDALTDVEQLGEWLMPSNFKPQVGHSFQFHYSMDGKTGSLDCKVLEVRKPNRLSYSWAWGTNDPMFGQGGGGNTTVTYIVEPVPGGSKLRLEHSGFGDANAMAFQMLSGGWQHKFDVDLPAAVEKRQKVAA